MENYGLIEPHEARKHNIYLFASLINSWGLPEYAAPLLESLTRIGEGYIYDALEALREEAFLIKYFPAIPKIASYIYASPDKCSNILELGFIEGKDLDYYNVQRHSIECKTYLSIGFRDTYDSVFHNTWVLPGSVAYQNELGGKILLRHLPRRSIFSSLEKLMEEEIIFQIFFEKTSPSRHSENSLRHFCPVCSIEKVLIAEFLCKNTEQEILNLMAHLSENVEDIAESGKIIVSLR